MHLGFHDAAARRKLLRLFLANGHPAISARRLIEMAITINGTAINLDWTTIIIWCLVGLVAGFLASRVALGHGLGLFGDVVVGILGAFLGGFLAAIFHIKVEVFGHRTISEPRCVNNGPATSWRRTRPG